MKDLVTRIVITAKDRASGTLDGLRRQFTGVRGAVVKLGAAIGTYLSLRSVVGFFTGSVKAAASLEEQLATVGAVTRASAEDMDRLKASAEEMGATTRYTATESAQAMEALGRAGLNTTEIISALPNVLALAQGNGLELARAASIITKAASGMGVAFEESGRLADVFTAAAARANTNVEDLAQAFSYAAPSARAAGLSVEELAAYVGKLADAGIDGSRAGTALNNMLSQFGNESSAFSKALRDAGIYTDDFNEALRKLEAAGDKGTEAINAIGQEAGPALKALLAQGTGSVAALSKELSGAEGEANRVAKAMDSNLNGALKALGSAWESLKTYIGDPLLEKVNTAARDLAETIRGLVTSGALEDMRAKIVDAFERGYEAIKTFLGGLDDGETLTEKLRGSTETLMGWFTKLGQGASVVGNTIVAAFKTVDSVVSAVAMGVVGAITVVQSGVNKLIQGMNAIGLASDETVRKSQALNETLVETTKQLGERSVQSAKDAAAAVDKAATSMEALAKGSDKATAANKKNAESSVEATKQALALGDELDKAAEAQRKMEAATDGTTEATKRNTEAQNELQNETEETAQAAAKLEAAFKTLGVTSTTALKETAAKSREAYQTIRASEAPVQDVRRAFEKYAQAAVDANDGVASAALEAEAAQNGLKLAVDESGKVATQSIKELQLAALGLGKDGRIAGEEIEAAMLDAADATGQAGSAAGSASGDYDGMAASAERAADAAERAARAEEKTAADSGPGSWGNRSAPGINPKGLSDEDLEKRIREAENYRFNLRWGGIWGFGAREYYEGMKRDEAEMLKAEEERRRKERDQLDQAADRSDRERKRQPFNQARFEEQDTQQTNRGGMAPEPVRRVRLEIGSSSVDVPEDQADSFIRELRQAGMRAS